MTNMQRQVLRELPWWDEGARLGDIARVFGYGPIRRLFLYRPLAQLERQGLIVSRYRVANDGGWERVYQITMNKERAVSMPEKVTGVDLTDQEQLDDQPPLAVGDTAEELLEDEEKHEDEEDEDRATDAS